MTSRLGKLKILFSNKK